MPTEARVGVPDIPSLDDDLLASWHGSHRAAADAVGALGPELERALRRWARGHLLLGLAGRSPSLSGGETPPLLPAPRAFLSAHDRARLAGTAAAFDHVDVRIALVGRGLETELLRPETPYVLHALAESGTTGFEDTNPGVLRTRVAGWLQSVSPYVHPPADLVRPIIDLLVATATTASAPAPAVAAWTAFTWMSVHPWVDGNGRTARLLYLLLTGPHLPLDLDLGVVEQMTYHRGAYVAALQAGQHVTPVYDPDRLDASPFAAAATRWSVEGARLLRERARVLGAADARLADARPDLDEAARALSLWVGLERHAPASRFERPADPTLAVMVAPVPELEALCEVDAICRRPLPASRRPPGTAPTIGYAAGPAVTAALGDAVHERMSRDGR